MSFGCVRMGLERWASDVCGWGLRDELRMYADVA